MKVLELSKNYVKNFYNNNFDKAIKALDGVLFDDKTVKKAFNLGCGAKTDLLRFINNNRANFKYYDLINKKYI